MVTPLYSCRMYLKTHTHNVFWQHNHHVVMGGNIRCRGFYRVGIVHCM